MTPPDGLGVGGLTPAQRDLLRRALVGGEGLKFGYVHVRGASPIRSAERLVKAGLLVAHDRAFTGGRYFEITRAGRKAVES